MNRKNKKESFFWTSYSDLMTSLFFVMLVLFVLTISLLHRKVVDIENIYNATQAQLDKIQEVEKATQNIDPDYFEYKPKYKKHILRISVWFPAGEANMNYISDETRQKLSNAGVSIKNFIDKNSKEGIQYLLIIEGQASRDNYLKNYDLSYGRALALKRFWEEQEIDFGNSCEVLICGSGDGKLSGTGFMREQNESENQRFLIHIVPKYGMIGNNENQLK